MTREEIIAADTEFQERIIAEVDGNGPWSVTFDDGWSLWVEGKIPPAVGMKCRQYGRGIGFPVRGLTLFVNDHWAVVYYRTEAEERDKCRLEHEEYEAQKKHDHERTVVEKDCRIAAMPTVFRDRIKGFQAARPDWRWQHEPYELFVCEEAIRIAEAIKDGEAIKDFAKMECEAQKKIVPSLQYAEHSGNTFGAACRLAWLYVTHPEFVAKEHGALCPLVGCEDYGCVPARKEQAA